MIHLPSQPQLVHAPNVANAFTILTLGELQLQIARRQNQGLGQDLRQLPNNPRQPLERRRFLGIDVWHLSGATSTALESPTPQRGCLDVDSMEQPPRETASEHNSKMHVASCSKLCFSHYAVLASFTHKTWKKHAGLEKG